MSENLYLTIRVGPDPATATPVLASANPRAVRAAARALIEALGLDERRAIPVLALHDHDPESCEDS